MSLNVVYASDENYAMYTGVSLCSLFENNKSLEGLTVYILDNGVVEQSKQKLERIAATYDRRLIFVDAAKKFSELAKTVVMKGSQTVTTYASCFLADILDSKIERVLYMDGDSLVCGDLSELAQNKMNDLYVCGTLDVVSPEVRRGIGLNNGDVYINAGFLYLNLKLIREDSLRSKIVRFIEEVIPYSLHNDQDVINGVLRAKMQALPARYNVVTPIFEKKRQDLVKFFRLEGFYSEEELSEAKRRPIFIHFTPSATGRPWIKGCKHPFKKEWERYKNMTEWRDVPDKPDKRKIKKRIVDFMFKNVNTSLYMQLLRLRFKKEKKRCK